ncbi:sodium-translocating pyrophosphatase [Candidatus Woesearchaeota archaeon]|nr:sodium-translocating pyrophosphatase [Candidatus Woesearchaeota archaeon]
MALPESWAVGISMLIGILALAVALQKSKRIFGFDPGNQKMQEISRSIHDGALTFLKKEYLVFSGFVIIIAMLLLYFGSWKQSVGFVAGGFTSALAGYIGMGVATKANVRAAQGAKKSLNQGLLIAFSSGSVMGLAVVGLGVLGIGIFYLLFRDPYLIYSFGFGASSIALFARVGGGIYTKAADVGADLVGKVEAGIPEDDPRNPAVIADNVGDNVGDIAGMGADLFESYVESIIAAMVIGSAAGLALGGSGVVLVIFPLLLSALGIVASIIGMGFVKASGEKAQRALDRGVWASSLIVALGSYFLATKVIPGEQGVRIFFSVLSGLAAGLVIGISTEYFTSNGRRPTKAVAEASLTGGATNIIEGLSLGMASTVIPVFAIGAAILVSYHFGGLYGIAIAAVGMLSTLGMTLATDCYGPVADNAAGISEMAGLGGNIRKRCEHLDSVGNTTAAMGKGFAIGSAALTALALFASFVQVASQLAGKEFLISITSPLVIVGIFLGALLPFIFSSLALHSVGKAAFSVISEVRRQFRSIKGLRQGNAKPDSNRCIAIVTGAALKEMMLPGLLAVLAPLIVGYFFGVEALGGLLVGATATGFLLALFMANAGASWDNAKKYIEDGKLGGKGSEAHKVAVIGDTVGDPMKDTAGPSLNILIKLISIVALVALPFLV